jgi:hypothetical protein
VKPIDVGRTLFALFLMLSSCGFVIRFLVEMDVPYLVTSIAVIANCAGCLWVFDRSLTGGPAA